MYTCTYYTVQGVHGKERTHNFFHRLLTVHYINKVINNEIVLVHVDHITIVVLSYPKF